MDAPFDAGITTRSLRRALLRARKDATLHAAVVRIATATMAVPLACVACGGSVPRPTLAAVAVEDYVQVPAPPGPARVEELPPSPRKDAVWVDGQWSFTGAGYRWEHGAWVVPPPGARFAPAVVVRREKDDALFFARASWKDASGRTIDAPEALARPVRKGGLHAGEAPEGDGR